MTVLSKEQQRLKRLREYQVEQSRKYEDNSQDGIDERNDEVEQNYNKYKRVAGGNIATAVGLSSSFHKEISNSIKGIAPSISKTMSSSLGGLMQGASSSIGYSKRIAEADRQRVHQKELGGLGRVNQGMNIFKSIMPTMITGNIAKGLMTGASNPVGLSSMFNPMMFGGMMGLSFLTKMMTNKKISNINVTRKALIAEQRRLSISHYIDAQVRSLSLKGAIQPADQLQLALLGRIEANSVFQLLTYQLLEKQRREKEESHDKYQQDSIKGLYGDESEIGGVGKMLNKLEDNINMFNLKYNPILQLTNFLIGKKLPKQAVDEIESRLGENNERKSYEQHSRMTGISSDHLRLLDTDANQLAGKGVTYEQKMFVIASGQYEMMRFMGGKFRELLTGLGIENIGNSGIGYESGVFGKLTEGIKEVMMNIPGLNAVTNLTKGLFTGVMNFHGNILPKIVTKFKTMLFGQEFLDIQNEDHLEKKLGLHKTADEKAKDFLGQGLPTEVKRLVKVNYEQLVVLKNIYSVSEQLYQLQSEGDTHQYDDTLYEKDREEKIWDHVSKRYVTAQQFEKNLEARMDSMMFEHEQAFGKSMLGKIMHTFDVAKGIGNVLVKGGTGRIRGLNDLSTAFKDKTGDLEGDRRRMLKATRASKSMDLSMGITDELEQQFGGMIDEDRIKQIKTAKRLESHKLSGAGQDQLFDIDVARKEKDVESRTLPKIIASATAGGMAVLLGGLGGSLGTGLISKLALGGLGMIPGLAGFMKTEKKFKEQQVQSADPDKIQRMNVDNITELIDEDKSTTTSVQTRRIRGKSQSETSLLLLSHFIEFKEDFQKNIVIQLKNQKFLSDSYKVQKNILDILFQSNKNENDMNKILTDIEKNTKSISKETRKIRHDGFSILSVLKTSFEGRDSVPSKLDELITEVKEIKTTVKDSKKTSNIRFLEEFKRRRDQIRIQNNGAADDYDIIEEILKNGTNWTAKGGKNLTHAIVGENIKSDGSISGYPEIVTGKFDVVGQKDTRRILNRMGFKTLADGTDEKKRSKKFQGDPDKEENTPLWERGLGGILDVVNKVKKDPKRIMDNPILNTILGLSLGYMMPGLGGVGLAATLGLGGIGLGFASKSDTKNRGNDIYVQKLKTAFEKAEENKAKRNKNYIKKDWNKNIFEEIENARLSRNENYEKKNWIDVTKPKSFLDKIGIKGMGLAGGLGLSMVGGPLLSLITGMVGPLLQGILPSFLFKGAMGGLGLALGPLAPILGTLGALGFTMWRSSKKKKEEKIKEVLEKNESLKYGHFESFKDEDKIVALANEQHLHYKTLRDLGLAEETLGMKMKGKGRLILKGLTGGALGFLFGGPAMAIMSSLGAMSQELFKKDIDYSNRDPNYFAKFTNSSFEKYFGILPIMEALKEGEDGVPFEGKQLSDMYFETRRDKELLDEMIAKKSREAAEKAREDLEKDAEPRYKGGPIKPRKPYIVGEKGPELRTFDHPGKIVANDVFKGIKSEIEKSNVKLDTIINILNNKGIKLDDKKPINVEDQYKKSSGFNFASILPSLSFDKIKDILKGIKFSWFKSDNEEKEIKENFYSKIKSFMMKDRSFSLFNWFKSDKDDKEVKESMFKKIKDFLTKERSFSIFPEISFDKIKDILLNFGKQLMKIPNVIGSILSTSIKTLIKGFLSPFKFIQEAFSEIKLPSFKLGLEKFIEIPKTIFNAITSGAGKFWRNMQSIPSKISSMFRGMFSSMKEMTSKLYTDMSKGISKIYVDVTKGISSLYSDAKSSITKLYSDTKVGISKFINAINPINYIKGMASGISKWWSGDENNKGFKTKAYDFITMKSLRNKFKDLMKSSKQKNYDKQDELEKNVKKQKWSEDDFRSEVVFYLEKIYHRLGKLTENTKEGIFSKIGSGASKVFSTVSGLFKGKEKDKKKPQGHTQTLKDSLKQLSLFKEDSEDDKVQNDILENIKKINANTKDIDELAKSDKKQKDKDKKKDGIWGKILGFVTGMLGPVLLTLGPAIAAIAAFISSDGKIGGKALLGMGEKAVRGTVTAAVENKGVLGKGLNYLGRGAKWIGNKTGLSKGLSKVGEVTGISKVAGFLSSKTDKLYGMAATGLEKIGATKLGQSFAGKFVKGLGTQFLGKLGIKIAEGGLKKALTKIPIVGTLFGIYFGLQRAMKGDFLGGALELASGIAGGLGGPWGWGISLAIDGLLMWRDSNKEKEEKIPGKSLWSKITEWLADTTKNIIYGVPLLGPVLKAYFDADKEIEEIRKSGKETNTWDSFATYVKNMALGAVRGIPIVGDWLANKLSDPDEKVKDLTKTPINKVNEQVQKTTGVKSSQQDIDYDDEYEGEEPVKQTSQPNALQTVNKIQEQHSAATPIQAQQKSDQNKLIQQPGAFANLSKNAHKAFDPDTKKYTTDDVKRKADKVTSAINNAGKIATDMISSGKSGLDAIIEQEGSYTSVNKNDSGKGVSLGKLQWNRSNAKKLLINLYNANPERFTSIMGKELVDLISDKNSDWHKNPIAFNKDQADRFKLLMSDSKMQSIMDQMAKSDYENYQNAGKSLGITDSKSLAYFADIANQYGITGAKSKFIGLSDFSIDSLHKRMMETGEHLNRRSNVYKTLQVSGEGISGLASRAKQGVINLSDKIAGREVIGSDAEQALKFAQENAKKNESWRSTFGLGKTEEDIKNDKATMQATEAVFKEKKSGSVTSVLGNIAEAAGYKNVGQAFKGSSAEQKLEMLKAKLSSIPKTLWDSPDVKALKKEINEQEKIVKEEKKNSNLTKGVMGEVLPNIVSSGIYGSPAQQELEKLQKEKGSWLIDSPEDKARKKRIKELQAIVAEEKKHPYQTLARQTDIGKSINDNIFGSEDYQKYQVLEENKKNRSWVSKIYKTDKQKAEDIEREKLQLNIQQNGGKGVVNSAIDGYKNATKDNTYKPSSDDKELSDSLTQAKLMQQQNQANQRRQTLQSVPGVGEILSRVVTGTKQQDASSMKKRLGELNDKEGFLGLGSKLTDQEKSEKQYLQQLNASESKQFRSDNKSKTDQKGTGVGSFTFPSKDQTITSPFGPRNAGPGASTDHKGIDFRARFGDPIMAAMPGTVINAGNNSVGGVTIDHGNGLSSRYLHLSSIAVKQGDQVQAGQVIGGAGHTSKHKMPDHLHFEVVKGKSPVDPELFIKSVRPGFNPTYAKDIKEKRQLSAKLGMSPNQLAEDSKLNNQTNVPQTQEQTDQTNLAALQSEIQGTDNQQPDQVAGGDDYPGYNWLASAKNTFKSLQKKVSDNIVQSIPRMQPIKTNRTQTNSGSSMPNMPIPVSVDNTRQEQYDQTFSKIDHELDILINNLFRSVCSSFENTINNYAFTTTASHSFF